MLQQANNECQKQRTKLYVYYDQNIMQTCTWKNTVKEYR